MRALAFAHQICRALDRSVWQTYRRRISRPGIFEKPRFPLSAKGTIGASCGCVEPRVHQQLLGTTIPVVDQSSIEGEAEGSYISTERAGGKARLAHDQVEPTPDHPPPQPDDRLSLPASACARPLRFASHIDIVYPLANINV